MQSAQNKRHYLNVIQKANRLHTPILLARENCSLSTQDPDTRWREKIPFAVHDFIIKEVDCFCSLKTSSKSDVAVSFHIS